MNKCAHKACRTTEPCRYANPADGDRRHYTEVDLGETIYSHGVPFEITTAATVYPASCIGDEGCRMVGTYRGEHLGHYPADNPLCPYVHQDGDEWTFQRYSGGAYVRFWNGSWHQEG